MSDKRGKAPQDVREGGGVRTGVGSGRFGVTGGDSSRLLSEP